MGFFSFETAWNTLQGYESMNMLRKGQMHGVEKGTSLGRSRSSPASLGCLPKRNERRAFTPIISLMNLCNTARFSPHSSSVSFILINKLTISNAALMDPQKIVMHLVIFP
jgi:hypothetical protein